MVFERLDGTFGRIDAVVHRLEKLLFAVLFLEEGFYRFRALIVRHIECRLVSFMIEFVEHGLEGGNNRFILEVIDGLGEDFFVS